MIRRIIENSHGHPLKNQKILLSSDYSYSACSQGKLITKPSHSKIVVECPSFLEIIQGDICGPLHPPCGPFKYFINEMVSRGYLYNFSTISINRPQISFQLTLIGSNHSYFRPN